MSLPEALAILAAGLAAGTINTVVGAGSLVTFPTLLAFGFPALVANVSNTVGLVPGNLSGVVAYRRELSGQLRRLLTLGAMSVLGGTAGALILVDLTAGAFRRVVPWLILLSCLLLAIGPRISAWLESRGERAGHRSAPLLATVLATGVYGGYFGAAQGVILIALLGIFVDDDLQRLNAAKNVLGLLANTAAAVVFVAASTISWEAAGLIALGGIIGGQIGGTFGRKLAPDVLRALIIVAGVTVAVVLIVD